MNIYRTISHNYIFFTYMGKLQGHNPLKQKKKRLEQ